MNDVGGRRLGRVQEDLVSLGRSIVDGSDYLTLATADADGTPWATPVWFAHDRYATFVWVSRPGARHSQNIEARPEVGFVIFDSTVRPGTGRGVYFEATAAPVGTDELDGPLATFSARSLERTGEPFTVADVTKPDGLRLYAATTTAQYVLDDHDQRIPVRL